MKTFQIAFLAASCVTIASAQAQKTAPFNPKAQPAPVLVSLPPSPVGGSDNCANAAANDAIVGTGTFAVNTVGATDSGFIAACTQVHNDVWFEWTAPGSGVATVSLCPYTGVDTAIAAYAGAGCPAGAEIACDDDGCAFAGASTMTFPVTAGSVYMLSIGSFSAAVTYAASMDINVSVPPANDSCATPIALAGPGLYPLDNSGASTGTEGQTEAACLFFGGTGLVKDVWYSYTPTTNGLIEVSTCGLIPGGSTDSRIAIYAGAGCPAAGTAIACNDDAGNGPGSGAACAAAGLNSTIQFTATCGVTYTIQIGNYYLNTNASIIGQFSVTETGGTTCATPVTYFCFGDGTGLACPCANSGAVGNGCANSLNANGGNLVASGNASVSGDTWLLSGSGIPNGPGLYYQAVNQLGGGNGVVFGDGIRCIGGSVIRLGIVTASGNASTYPTGVTPPNNIAISVKGFNLAGDVRNYQLWYRDSAIGFCSASVFNLTNALNVTWQP